MAKRINVTSTEFAEDHLLVGVPTSDGTARTHVPIPAVISCDKGDLKVRKANVKSIMQAKRATIDVRSVEAPPSVVTIIQHSPPPAKPAGKSFEGGDAARRGRTVAPRGSEHHLRDHHDDHDHLRNDGQRILTRHSPSSYERRMTLGRQPPCSLLATEATHADAARSIDGVDQVIALTSPAFSTYDASSWAAAIHATAPEGTIISLANARMKDLLARVAARRDLPVVQDVIAVEGTTFTQPLMSGKAMQTVEVEEASASPSGATHWSR